MFNSGCDKKEECNLMEYGTIPPGGGIPSDLSSCAAIDWGGLPVVNLAYKLEETDLGFDNNEDMMNDLEYQKDKYLRNAVTDRNLDIPFTESDLPSHNATRYSGLLNLRYNGCRGNSDYEPWLDGVMVGQDPFASQDTGLKLAEIKKFTAMQAQDQSVRFGDNSILEIPEQPWADPMISYAKKEAQTWTANIKNIWQWPSFENFQVSHKSRMEPIDVKKTMMDCAEDCPEELIAKDVPNDEQGKVRHNQVGFQYDLGQYQDHTIDFSDVQQNQVRSTKEPERVEMLRNKTKDGHNITDHSRKSKLFKTKLFEAMQSAVKSQELTGVMGNSVLGEKVKSGKGYDNKSVIKSIIDTQKRNKETMNSKRSGIIQTDDLGYVKRFGKDKLKETLQVKTNMIKGSRNGEDINFLKREIDQSMKLNEEAKSKLCTSGLSNYADRQAILRDIAITHKTGCSEKNKCFSGNPNPGQEQSIINSIISTQAYPDNPCNPVRSSKLLDEDPASIKAYCGRTDNTIDNSIGDTSRFEGSRNR